MTDSDPKSEPSDDARSQLEILDRFEHYRRTWELELLISGAVIFALLGVPARLEDWFFRLEVHASRDQFLVLFFTYYYFKLIAYSLIISFCVNLTARAYWIGLIGLNRVFPEGIRWRKLKDGPISQDVSRELPTLDKLIQTTDRAASLIFSMSFLLVIIFGYSIVLVGAASLVAWGVSSLAFGGEHLRETMYVLLALIFLPGMIAGLADKALLKKPREAWQGRWYVKPIRAILKAFSWVTLKPLYGPIQMTLTSNIRQQITVPLFLVGIFGVIGYFVASHFWQMSGRLAVDGYTLFPDVAVARGVDYRHYESLQPESEIERWAPSIQSDVIEDPFVKLFIPYSPFAHDRKLAKHCPEVEPVPAQKFYIRAKFNRRPPDESVDAALDCLGSFHPVYLNGERLELDFDFYARSDTGVRGIVAYIPTEGLPKGRNALRIERVAVKEDDEDAADTDEEETKTEYHVPFWI